MIRIAILIISLFIFWANISYAQIKVEKESRTNPNDIPASALQFIDACNFTNKIKWYTEVSENRTSFEAKTKHKGTHYSIEFDSTGIIEDVEWIVQYHKLPQTAKQGLDATLASLFEKYKILKIQTQYTGSADALQELIINEKTSKPFITRYETELSATRDNKFGYFEVLTNNRGEKIKVSQIIPPDTDNIIF